jgi:hypothetical protein
MTTPIKKQKFYAYIDESGQDTKGKFFVVSVLILEKNRELILKKLKKIEKESRKKKIKWHKAYYKYNQKYIEKILNSNLLKENIFFEIFYNTKEYLKCTAQATSGAVSYKIKNKKNYQIINYLDGFDKKEIDKFKRELKPFNIKSKKSCGVRKDENNAFIRLSDAICGLVRQAKNKNKWAESVLQEMKKRKIIQEV